jgi:hypothetical protein
LIFEIFRSRLIRGKLNEKFDEISIPLTVIDVYIRPDYTPQSLGQLFVAARIEGVIVFVLLLCRLLQLNDVEHVVAVLDAFERDAVAGIIGQLLAQHHAEFDLVGLDEFHVLW